MAPVPELEELIATVDDRSPADHALARLAVATEVSREVERLGEDLVTHFVDAARAGGASWADIGAVLGVSRQGAHQRHADRPRPDRWWQPSSDRTTTRARAAVKASIEAAMGAGNEVVGTEHLLLGLLDVPGNLALAAIEDAGVDPATLRREAEARLRPPLADHHDARHDAHGRRLPFTPLARRAFDVATAEALALGHNYLGCEHLLLALAGMGEGTAHEALVAAGLEVGGLRESVIEVLPR